MANARKRARQRRRAKSLIGSMREFLTSEVFKQVRNSSRRRKSPRWDLHPLLYILLLTTYCCGDSLPEKFEAARAFYVTCCPKRKRPGKGFAGFEKAVAKAAHARAAVSGGGDSSAGGNGFQRSLARSADSFRSAATEPGRHARAARNWKNGWARSAKKARRR